MKLYLGTPEESWLHRPERPDVPMFVSRHRLIRRTRKNLRPATRRWALDSGGFTQIRDHGRWTITPGQYAEEVDAYVERIGGLDFAAQMDWMCEPFMVARTGLSVREHQERTVANFLELRVIAPDLPIVPVLQGYTVAEYRACLALYTQAGVVLADEPLVGLGSVCRRQGTGEIARLVSELACAGLKLHGFGVKTGAHRYGYLLASADSMAWSSRARSIAYHGGDTGLGCEHRSCANCLRFALAWRDGHVDRLARATVQADLFESLAGVA